jgi:hypothetical protein
MAKRRAFPKIAWVAMCLLFSPLAHAQEPRQPGAVYDFDKKGEKAEPAPSRDISGTWEPASGPGGGIQGKGALSMESCRRATSGGRYAVDLNPPISDTGYATSDCLRPAIEPPYTALGLEALKGHKPTEGYRMVPSAVTNDPSPLLGCEPGGFPRIVLHNFRTSQIIQTPQKVVILYEFNRKWRTIWTDGRVLPKDSTNPTWGPPDSPEPRWWGYSVGKWVDDYTFVAQTTGFENDRTWLDNAGLPHSDALVVEETYHRKDRDHLEMSIKVTDPKFYTKPWIAMDKLSLRLQAPGFDIREMECSPSDSARYQDLVGAGGISEKEK